MNTKEINRVIGGLPKGKTEFLYTKDGYALDLLADFVGTSGRTIRTIKSSQFAPLLNRPNVRELLAELGGGRLYREDIETRRPPKPDVEYSLSVGTWGEENPDPYAWYQTSVPGMNLVLHMNFCDQDVKAFSNAFHSTHSDAPFSSLNHPHKEGEFTMAWTRIEIDTGNGEALIEEVQNDWLRATQSSYEWLRDVLLYKKRLDIWGERYLERRYGSIRHMNHAFRYMESTLRKHGTIWSEAMLCASIRFLKGELGIRRIFFHTHETGNYLKEISKWDCPPRSLYTDLPKRFCFIETKECPVTVDQHWSTPNRYRTDYHSPRFFLLEL